jgi:AraC-like DNA-binding protein
MMERRLHRRRLAAVPGIIIDDVRADGGPSRWTPLGVDVGYAVILVRRGGFLRQSEGEEAFIDACGGFLSREGAEERFAYPLGGVDLCTVIGFTTDAYHEYVEPAARDSWQLTTDVAFDVRHRRLLTACERGIDRFEAAEGIHLLLERLPIPIEFAVESRSSTRIAHRRLAAGVQEALSNGYLTSDLAELARLVGSSPHHLSRVFRRVTGRTISAYRNEMRVRSVLGDLAAGAADIAQLASRYGFADHAHLTRTVRRYTAKPPSALRLELSMNVQATEVTRP